MAIYHFSMRNISRSRGSSSIASLSYILGEPLKDDRLGVTSYQHKNIDNVVFANTVLPSGASAELQDPERLFNSIEAYEKNSNARVAKRIIVALPNETSLEQNKEIMAAFCSRITDMGYAVTYSIHYDQDNKNHHCHILIPNRQIDPKTGTWAKNKRHMEYVLDDKGERVPLIDPQTGKQKVDKRNRKQWKRISIDSQPLDRKETLQNLRKGWAQDCNRYLDAQHHISEKSYADQGLNQIPTIHEGVAARAMAQKREDLIYGPGEPDIDKIPDIPDRVKTNMVIRVTNRKISILEAALEAVLNILWGLYRALEIMVNPKLYEDKQAFEAGKIFGIDTDYAYDENMVIVSQKETGHDGIYDAVMGVKNWLLESPDHDERTITMFSNIADADTDEDVSNKKELAEKVVKSVRESLEAQKSNDAIVAAAIQTIQNLAKDKEQKKRKNKKNYRDEELEI